MSIRIERSAKTTVKIYGPCSEGPRLIVSFSEQSNNVRITSRLDSPVTIAIMDSDVPELISALQEVGKPFPKWIKDVNPDCDKKESLMVELYTFSIRFCWLGSANKMLCEIKTCIRSIFKDFSTICGNQQEELSGKGYAGGGRWELRPWNEREGPWNEKEVKRLALWHALDDTDIFPEARREIWKYFFRCQDQMGFNVSFTKE